MSRNTRQRRQTQINMASPQISAANDRIIEGKNAINSPNLFNQSPEYIQAVWQKLRQAYEATAGESQECQPFPLWALKQFKHNHVEKVIRFGYPEDIGMLKTYAPSAPDYFKADQWKFILFFNHIEQGRARAINDVIKSRVPLRFKKLYKEVLRHRSSRVQGRTTTKIEFQPSDFRACCKESTSIEDSGESESDIEIIESSDDEEEDGINGDETDSEPEHVVFSPNPDLPHEMGYTFGQDAHTIGNQSLEETGCLGDNSSYLNTPNSNDLIQDDVEAPGGANTADITANRIDLEARSREISPEQSSPPTPHPTDGSTLNVEEQFLRTLRDVPTMRLKLEQLKAQGEAAEKNIKTSEAEVSTTREQLHQFARNGTMEYVLSLCSDLAKQERKRKMEEENKIDTDRKKAKVVAQLNAIINAKSNQFEAQLRTNIQRHEAA